MSEWNAGSVVHFAWSSLAWFLAVLGGIALAYLEWGSGTEEVQGAGYFLLLVEETWGPLAVLVLIGWVVSLRSARFARGFGVIPIFFIAIALVWLWLHS